MQDWMIVLIVLAAVIVAVTLGFVIAAAVFFRYVFGRGRPFKPSGNGKKYGMDFGWFDLSEIKASISELEIKSFDGLTLGAVYLRARENNDKVVVLQHGYRADWFTMQPYARMFFERGYDVLMPSARAHGKSDGKYIGMAWLDRFDMLRWVGKLNELYEHRADIVLMGVSMGGSTAVAVTGMTPPPEIKCVIDDCGFSSVSDEYDACFRRTPTIGKIMRPSLDTAMRLKHGYSLDGADITELASKSATPTLFIHGTKDDFVPFELGQKLYAACSAQDKRFYSVEGAGHGLGYACDPDKYTSVVFEFVDKYIKS